MSTAREREDETLRRNAEIAELEKAKSAARRAQATLDNFSKLGVTIAGDALRKLQDTARGLSSAGLAEATKRKQEELSNIFGIPTFDIIGSISTVPDSGEINPDINVGTGRFTAAGFADQLNFITKGDNVLDSFAAGINDIFIKPIVEGFNQLFERRSIEDLTEEQQIRVRAIDQRIEILESKLVPVPECRKTRSSGRFVGSIWVGSYRTDCSGQRAANAKNAPFTAEIELLKKERESIFETINIAARFNQELEEKFTQLKQLLDTDRITAELKVTINEELQIASKLIESILANKIEVDKGKLLTLQQTMQALAFKLQEPITQKNAEAEGILGILGLGIEGFAAGFNALLEKLPKSLEEAMINATLATRPTAAQISEMEKPLIEYRQTEYAKFIEESQKFLAGETQ